MPIPFAYWHLMNLVFFGNFMMLGLLMSAYRNPLSVIPYACTLLIVMGLRNASNMLADPFGGHDCIDFPFTQFFDYAFDHSLCLLHSFSKGEAYARVGMAVETAKPFTDDEVRRKAKPEVIYNEKFRAHVDGTYLWSKPTPIQRIKLDRRDGEGNQLQKTLASTLAKAENSMETSSEDNDDDPLTFARSRSSPQAKSPHSRSRSSRQLRAGWSQRSLSSQGLSVDIATHAAEVRTQNAKPKEEAANSRKAARALASNDVSIGHFDAARTRLRQVLSEAEGSHSAVAEGAPPPDRPGIVDFEPGDVRH